MRCALNFDERLTFYGSQVDATFTANSGHPGAPMGMAPVAHILFNKFMSFNPQNPKWLNRDRFVLSNGHGCMLQYALLHLFGYKVSTDDLKNFRVRLMSKHVLINLLISAWLLASR